MRKILFFALLLMGVACGNQAPMTPRAAAEQTCDQLIAGEYDAVLNHMMEMQALACGQSITEDFAEQAATVAIREMMKVTIRSVFENTTNPVTGYEIVQEEFSPDSTRALVVVRFTTQVDTLNLAHTFSMRKQEDGSWHSVQ